jgi:transcriptional regulator with XRE-family HTH domain
MDLSQTQLGRHLAAVRERAGLKQAELARRVTWSQAVLSRIEAGERSLSDDELADLLDAIGTEEATQLAVVIRREWRALTPPSLDHPDHELLWDTERLAQDLEQVVASPGVRPAFEQRIREYISELTRLAQLLDRRDHEVAFAGPIGVGKSTAICAGTELTVVNERGDALPVLETGAGGVTLCDVHLRVGPRFGVMVEPRSEDEIRAYVADFVDYLLRSAGEAETDADSQVVSREIERAIRNMSGLQRRRAKGPDGRMTREDPARELALTIGDRREVAVEILARMQLHRRDRRDAWFDPVADGEPLEWLRRMFAEINNGRHAEFSLPARVELVVPQLFETARLTVAIVDTRGIDQPSSRADLEAHLSDPHTVSVLCSGFNDAPAGAVQTLLGRSREIGNKLVDTNACLLVLPRPGEALAVKDESGVPVESAGDGYELKAEQVAAALDPLRLAHLPIGFFNALEDKPENLRSFVVGRVEAVRDVFRHDLMAVIDGGRALLANRALEEVQEVQRAAARLVATWLDEHADGDEVDVDVHASLLAQIATAHAATVHASVRREGEWLFLSYTHELGHGARRVATSALGGHVAAFADFVRTLSSSDDYKEAGEILTQAERLLSRTYDELLLKVQLAGETMFVDDLRGANQLWECCADEWGRGSGYRSRVAEHNRAWFGAEQRVVTGRMVRELIAREWRGALARVRAIFDLD